MRQCTSSVRFAFVVATAMSGCIIETERESDSGAGAGSAPAPAPAAVPEVARETTRAAAAHRDGPTSTSTVMSLDDTGGTRNLPGDWLECGDSGRHQRQRAITARRGRYASFWACAVVGRDSYTGNEQHFFFEHPGTGYVRIGLDSPCEDLDLFVIRWDGNSCLHPELSIVECEGQVSSGGGWLYIWNNAPAGYVVVVDGPNGENGPYGVTLNCDDYDPFAR